MQGVVKREVAIKIVNNCRAYLSGTKHLFKIGCQVSIFSNNLARYWNSVYALHSYYLALSLEIYFSTTTFLSLFSDFNQVRSLVLLNRFYLHCPLLHHIQQSVIPFPEPFSRLFLYSFAWTNQDNFITYRILFAFSLPKSFKQLIIEFRYNQNKKFVKLIQTLSGEKNPWGE